MAQRVSVPSHSFRVPAFIFGSCFILGKVVEDRESIPGPLIKEQEYTGWESSGAIVVYQFTYRHIFEGKLEGKPHGHRETT